MRGYTMGPMSLNPLVAGAPTRLRQPDPLPFGNPADEGGVDPTKPATDGLRLLHVHAHPDDESSKGAATTGRYVSEGVRVMVATCTGGERGSVLNPRMDRPEVWQNIAEIRRAEMDKARAVLGVEQRWLGWVDSGLPEGDPLPPLPKGCFALMDVDVAAEPLVRILREFRPQVVTTYDENGGYPHPDHIMTHKVTMRAVALAADPSALPDAGPVWQISKLYYSMTFHPGRVLALDRIMTAHGLESPYTGWGSHDRKPGSDERITTYVPCADWFSVRDAALLAHATQIDPDGAWFAVPRDLEREAWPTEDFELVFSAVPTSIPEDDLFEGLRPQD